MEDLAYYNGKITRLSEMMVPFNDRSHFFGDGVYDASVARNGIIFKLEDHLDRFFNSMALIDIQPDFTKDELRELLQALCQKLDTGDLFVYFQVSRGTAIRNHSYAQTLKPNLSVYMLPWTGDFSSQKRLKLMTTPDHRFEFCHIKTLNLLPNVLASQAATSQGLDEVVYHRDQRVTECAHSNISILINGVFQTAPLDHWILPGIARKYLLLMSQALGFDVLEHPFTVEEMLAADEVIVSSSGSLCAPVSEIDGRAVGGRDPERLQQLQDKIYQDFFKETDID
ncbi:MAG: aminotransferase class IV [Lactococcus raffinolactis]|jgi:D-alanine transaminase|uniref:D-amino acid aminotransferase n=1 Tax=Pseudolactococcus raffinolactis TaxID=1366 RepID=A0A6H0U9Z3_9LACT|nr:aminotransferase class IV [Lactococcus raffinolactis]MBR2541680.1 aminotransferase class IV [Lactococcus sp.]MDG4961916.1 aminotransferase class IV [Lactococcus raffinolactis]MDN5412932.1 aminotransferase class IV [Lactococcus raffinolactis]MDN5414576.1 aminotransferase class IV [Lactococcus raffinolactis]MDN5472455.1 aminotransferase class IV [Lactococcus raffinolactis]